jgi:4-amino-4-deoxy-L-arabinose transferase-like glycosyltransferase
LVLFGVVVWQLVVPRPYLTGSNSVGVNSVAANVNPGQTLCVPNLRLPAETGGVQLAVLAHRARFTASVSVSAEGGTVFARMAGAPGRSWPAFVTAMIPRTPVRPEAVHASLCVSPLDGPISLGGVRGQRGEHVPTLLAGARLPNWVAVRFVPPAGHERSVLASTGEIFRRASLFRPGVIGAWTYPFLLLVVAPLTWLAALLLLARAATGRQPRLGRRAVRPAAAIAVIAFVNAASWALITPSFNGPDEPAHFAYAQYFAETGHAPDRVDRGRPVYSSSEFLAVDTLHTYSQIAQPATRPPWLAFDQALWERRTALKPHPLDNGGGFTVPASPHQPAYYALLAPAYLAVASQSTFSQLLAMRLTSALLGVVAAVCAFAIVRELLPRQQVAAAAAGLLVAFEPMYGFISGAVNNDNGINAAAALSLYLAIRGLRRGLSVRLALALGVTLAVAPLMKETGYEIYAPAAVALLGMAWRRHRRRDAPAWAALAAAFAAVRVSWSLLQPVFYPALAGRSGAGGIDAAGAVATAWQMPGRFLTYLWQVFLPPVAGMPSLFPPGWPFRTIYLVRGWGAFGRYTQSFPGWVYAVILVVIIVVGVLAVSAAIRERVAARARTLELAVIALFPISVFIAVEATFFIPHGGRTNVPEQGRYMFPAIAALAVIVVGGAFGLGRRWHATVATVLVVAMIGLSYASQLVTLSSFYA